MPPPLLEPKRFKAGPGAGERVGFIAARDLDAGAPLLTIPESVAITAIDAEKHPVVGGVAKGCGELVALALWLMAERAAAASGGGGAYAPLLAALPESTDSPILWDDKERDELLRGSPVLEEARARRAALQQQWAQLAEQWAAAEPATFDAAAFNEASFLRAFAVVLANAGQEVLLNDGRPNGEMLLCFGTVQDSNLADCLYFDAELVRADKYYTSKEQLMTSMGMTTKERFPVFADRFPIQLLAYLRLSRIQDPALFAKVSFESDSVISQMNEYEVLQLLMGDCREKLAEYSSSLEEEIKELQSPNLVGRARLAARLRFAEKTILTQFMDAVRRKLAPVRGIPTKSGGMQDPNSDLKEIFDVIESIPAAPAKLFDGFKRWARGEFDPDWNK
ncbi:MAG: rubisco small subunit N-methyltransferase [Monoraphidium minutum]|nr:MAG: rubisco small subunit N-methyltransferase [Monoraphidium minutum]